MGTLSRWEQRMERWERALLDRILRREPAEAELLTALRRECDARAVVCSHSRVVAPNLYEVELPEGVSGELARHGGQVLAENLARYGERKGYEWAGPLTVRVVTTSEPLPNGRYRVTSAAAPNVSAAAFPAHD
ncbi:DUF2662 domain-containing protein [Streptomyces carminius]|uniref:DUF2662 domain-containing protein n=1 Tax=Streptomyces carminius TaxID=2665496 RepID=A0A2M8LU56_9ACTN|nr:FhaA domain-containing protein [Streptomyces carminius]PJE95486.1 DUF2662 domain-containing protein [Streptomyces carminius]